MQSGKIEFLSRKLNKYGDVFTEIKNDRVLIHINNVSRMFCSFTVVSKNRGIDKYISGTVTTQFPRSFFPYCTDLNQM